MAEAILGSLVGSIGKHLVSLLSEEIRLADDVKLELQNLGDKVSIIQGVLGDAENRQIDARDVKAWLEQLKQVAYEADDLLDDFSTEVLRRGRTASMVRTFFSSSNQLTYAHNMAYEVTNINKRIEVILQSRKDFELPRINNLPNWADNHVRPQTFSYKPELSVIGRDQDKKEVIKFLLNPDFEDDVSIFPIVGIGGLGKTTLARLVFNDEGVKNYFKELKVWLCISTNFVVEDILRKIVEECNGKIESDYINTNELHKKIDALLRGKRFLIVLDDVWNDNRREWLNLQGYLNCGARGSKILVTTRSPSVAKTMAANYHKLSGLSEMESLSLLMRMAMKQDDEWKNQNLETIAKDIFNKCVGVPLAITTFGRLLLHRGNTEEEWLRFKNKDLARLPQNEDDIMPSLRLSYVFLPSYLKPCFAYCKLFPKDYELDPAQLIRLWVAQGFIKVQRNNEETLENVGQQYFQELVSRSFFQDLECDILGNVIRCKMHDLMHDLAESVADEDWIAIDTSKPGQVDLPEARHESILAMKDHNQLKKLKDKKIRSLLCSYEGGSFDFSFTLDLCLFGNLRALCLRGFGMKVPRSIGKLKHLRSLDLSGNRRMTSLPNSVGKLCNLETLILKDCGKLKSLPSGITKLGNLRELDIAGCTALTHMPRGIRGLSNLQLSTFVVGEKCNGNAARINELEGLAALRKGLKISRVEKISSEESFSVEKLDLQDLELDWTAYEENHKEGAEKVLERFRTNQNLKSLSINGYPGRQLSSWIFQMQMLVIIKISDFHRVRYLPPLDQLPSLKIISLSYSESLEWIELSENSMRLQINLFPSLEKVQFTGLIKFKGWERKRTMRMEDEEGIKEDSSSLSVIPIFFDKVTALEVDYPSRFSFMRGDRQLQLVGMEYKILQEMCGQYQEAPSTDPSSSSRITFIPISSIPLPRLTSLSLSYLTDTEHMPVELFQSLPSLKFLEIKSCPRLKSLPGKAILRGLISLESLRISHCDELDFSTEEEGNTNGDEGGEGTQAHRDSSTVLSSLESLELFKCTNMKALPEWFFQLTSLNNLCIRYCEDLSLKCKRDKGEYWPKISKMGIQKVFII
ncbi:hypothetical protein SAY86_019258 [Trapa natans]|uniref:Disease resistance protein RGA3 n=1 Tax=Trapa natans TaxID=22666 RepID=A0AAN7LGD9_TRANT|nr:hypothetical protein SAY86_019258 [Trapa natans]